MVDDKNKLGGTITSMLSIKLSGRMRDTQVQGQAQAWLTKLLQSCSSPPTHTLSNYSMRKTIVTSPLRLSSAISEQ